MKEVGYVDQLGEEYTKGLVACNSQGDLVAHLVTWQEFCKDALEQVKSKDFLWDEYKKGEKLERRGKYSGDAWVKKYGAILLPSVFLHIGLIAQRFGAPEGTAFHRMKELGAIKTDENGYYVIEQPK